MASAVHKNTDTKAASVNVNSVCRQNTAEQGMAAPDEFMAEVQWSMAIRKMIAKLEFGDALKLLMLSVLTTHMGICIASPRCP